MLARNFIIRTKNPWLVMITYLLVIASMVFIAVIAGIDISEILNNGIRENWVIIIAMGLIPFLVVWGLFQLLFPTKIKVVLTDSYVDAQFQKGIFCLSENRTIRKQEILSWSINYPRSWDLLKIKTAEGTFAIRSMRLGFLSQSSFRSLEKAFREFMET